MHLLECYGLARRPQLASFNHPAPAQAGLDRDADRGGSDECRLRRGRGRRGLGPNRHPGTTHEGVLHRPEATARRSCRRRFRIVTWRGSTRRYFFIVDRRRPDHPGFYTSIRGDQECSTASRRPRAAVVRIAPPISAKVGARSCSRTGCATAAQLQVRQEQVAAYNSRTSVVPTIAKGPTAYPQLHIEVPARPPP